MQDEDQKMWDELRRLLDTDAIDRLHQRSARAAIAEGRACLAALREHLAFIADEYPGCITASVTFDGEVLATLILAPSRAACHIGPAALSSVRALAEVIGNLPVDPKEKTSLRAAFEKALAKIPAKSGIDQHYPSNGGAHDV